MKRKIIAFYLPQFHEIPENDNWWGKGFTEWSNVKKAKPLFEGHVQPKEPLNNNYYNLLDIETLKWQARLAKENGVYGFCFYHYWFNNGKKLLEKPVEMFLNNKDIDMHFCLSWANESWARTWDGGDYRKRQEILQKQQYGGPLEWEKHIDYILDFCEDNRYIKINNKPLIIIYKPNLIKNLKKMLLIWESRAKERGFEGLVLAYQSPESYFDGCSCENMFDYVIRFEPLFTGYLMKDDKQLDKAKINRDIMNEKYGKWKKWLFEFQRKIGFYYKKIKTCLSDIAYSIHRFERKHNRLQILDYSQRWEKIIETQAMAEDPRLIPGAFVSWDNTPRKRNGIVYIGSTPEKFEKYITELINVSTYDNSEMLFVNAWNEWAEGAYLEPDKQNEYGYLQAIRKANL